MSDPKQPIYNALNWMGGAMQSLPPNDDELIIAAYEQVYRIDDKKAQTCILDVIQRLTFRNHRMTTVVQAWEKSTEQLRQACQMIEKQASAATSESKGDK
jgi:hypothetical protein